MWCQVLCLTLVLSIGGVSTLNWDPAKDCPFSGVSFCHCDPDILDCVSRNLKAIPIFNDVAHHFQSLNLGSNSISNISASAFRGLNVSRILLDNNTISFIHDDAFKGVEDTVEVLDLSRNRLTTLPTAVGTLRRLSVLDIEQNPIHHENHTEDVLREVGDTLDEFHFGSSVLREWPTSLHHLQQLKNLSFAGGQMERLPITAFRGFEWTLRRLWISNTNLIAVPIALQDLKSTIALHFDNNQRVDDAGILIPAFAGIAGSLKELSLQNDSLTGFPPVLQSLLQLRNLSLAGNNLEFVSDGAVKNIGSQVLRILDLEYCNLDRIPGALSKLQGISSLDFSHNHITTIEKNDLQYLTSLRTLDLSYNPLQYISNSALSDLQNLTKLILVEVELYYVPQALRHLPALQLLDLRGDIPKVECNCDLGWLCSHLKHQDRGSLVIKGSCETISMDIQLYTTNRIPSVCPVGDCV